MRRLIEEVDGAVLKHMLGPRSYASHGRLSLAGRGARSQVGAGVPRSSQIHLGFRAHFSMICHKGKR